eukprot:1191491-Prorocentrum_minimum.AAC.1
MVADGMLLEAKGLLEMGLRPSTSPPTSAIGYRQAMEYLQVRRWQNYNADEFACMKTTLNPKHLNPKHPSLSGRGPQGTPRMRVRVRSKSAESASAGVVRANLHSRAALEDNFAAFLTAFQQASRQYTTRQMTWFRGDGDYLWIDMAAHGDDPAKVAALIQEELAKPAPSPADVTAGINRRIVSTFMSRKSAHSFTCNPYYYTNHRWNCGHDISHPSPVTYWGVNDRMNHKSYN